MTRMRKKGRLRCRQTRRTKTSSLDYMVCFSPHLLSSHLPPSFCDSCSSSRRCRRGRFPTDRPREDSCQILHLRHQGCCQVRPSASPLFCPRPEPQCDPVTSCPQRSAHVGGVVGLLRHQQVPAVQRRRLQ